MLSSGAIGMATSMRSGFLGTSLKDSRQVETAKAARSQQLQVQALFGGLKKGKQEAGKVAGKAQKAGKKAAIKAPSLPKLGAKKGTQTVKKTAKKATKGASGTKRTGGWLGGEGGAGRDCRRGRPRVGIA